MKTATGTFDVTLAPQPLHHTDASPQLGRLSIDKQFKGDLTAISTGEMLSARTEVEGSAGYVAIEHVTGTLNGRSGSFVLMHTGKMDRGASHLSVSVVPDSGTDELAGLTGTMTIDVTSEGHQYVFSYSV